VVRHQVALGHALSELRQLDDAQVALREALTTAERAYGPDNLEVAGVLDCLERAICLGVCGDAGPEELAIATRAHAIRERAWGGEDPRLRGSLEHLALKFAVRDRHADALALYERAIRLAEPCGPKDVHLLHIVGSALAETGRIDEALAVIERVLDIQATNGFATGLITLNFAQEVLEKANRGARFIVYVDRVLDGTEWKTDDEAQAKRGKVLALRARALVSAGRAGEAAGVAVEAIAVLERYYGADLRSMPALRKIASAGAPGPT